MLLGFFNVALILIALVSFIGMMSAVNSANGVTFQDYEVLGEEEIEQMFSEDAEAVAAAAELAAAARGDGPGGGWGGDGGDRADAVSELVLRCDRAGAALRRSECFCVIELVLHTLMRFKPKS